jgi:hypothetical protein
MPHQRKGHPFGQPGDVGIISPFHHLLNQISAIFSHLDGKMVGTTGEFGCHIIPKLHHYKRVQNTANTSRM